MSSSADLFVICKQCGSEVSPYITECPYCGHRLRRRAPKLPRENVLQRGPRGPLKRVRGLALFRGTGAAGALAASAAYPDPVVIGGNAAALGLLAAWAAPDLGAARAGAYYEGDLLAVGALAAVLLAIPFAFPRPEASW